MAYSGIQLPLLFQHFPDRLQRFAWFIITLPSDQHIVKIFPEFAVLIQADQDSGFFTRCICNELNAFQHLPIPPFFAPYHAAFFIFIASICKSKMDVGSSPCDILKEIPYRFISFLILFQPKSLSHKIPYSASFVNTLFSLAAPQNFLVVEWEQ